MGPEGQERGNPSVTLATVGLAAVSFSVMQSMVIPVLPTIQRSLGASENAVTWVLTGYLLSASVATPILGRLGDMKGKEKVLVWVLATLALGTLMAALAPTLPLLIAARIVQGVGGALFPLSFGIIRDEFPEERVAGAIGLIAATLAVGGGLGVVLSGLIADHFDYHLLFWCGLPLIVVAAVATWRFIPESPVRSGGRISWPGALLLSAWLVLLLLAVTEGSHYGWGAPLVVALFVGAVLAFVAWVWVEARSRNPLVDVRMLVRPAVWQTNVVAVLFGFVLYASIQLTPQLMQAPTSTGYGLGLTASKAGLLLLPQTIAVFVLGLLAGRVAASIGSSRAVLAGSALSAVAFSQLAMFHNSVWQVVLGNLVLGVGIGLTFSAMPNVIVEAVPQEQTGVATGMNANLRTIGGAIGGQVVASILAAQLLAGGVFPAENGFVWSYVLLAVLAAVAAAVAALVPARVRVARPSVAESPASR
jgi:EmrB/QacA subfamily drug resistance transporter